MHVQSESELLKLGMGCVQKLRCQTSLRLWCYEFAALFRQLFEDDIKPRAPQLLHSGRIRTALNKPKPQTLNPKSQTLNMDYSSGISAADISLSELSDDFSRNIWESGRNIAAAF